MKQLGINLLLVGAIGAFWYLILSPLIVCFGIGGEWKWTARICHMGTTEIPAMEQKEQSEQVTPVPTSTTPFSFDSLSRITIRVPDETDLSVDLMREDGTDRFGATFALDRSEEFPHSSAFIDSTKAVVDPSGRFVLLPLAVNTGGTGTFVYGALFAIDGPSLRFRDSFLLGDRISVTKLSFISESSIRIETLDRKKGEPSASTPSVPYAFEISFDQSGMLNDAADVFVYRDTVRVETNGLMRALLSPISFSGEARGNWFFEARFPVVVTDWDGKTIGEGVAVADGEWMTKEYVAFTVSIPFTLPPNTPYKHGVLILKKDNPSGLSQNDDAFEIPIEFQ